MASDSFFNPKLMLTFLAIAEQCKCFSIQCKHTVYLKQGIQNVYHHYFYISNTFNAQVQNWTA